MRWERFPAEFVERGAPMTLKTQTNKPVSLDKLPFMLYRNLERLIAMVDHSKDLWKPSWPQKISVEAKNVWNDLDRVELVFKSEAKPIAEVMIRHGGAFGLIDYLEFFDPNTSKEIKKSILQYACYQIASRSGVKVIEVCSNSPEETGIYSSIGFYQS